MDSIDFHIKALNKFVELGLMNSTTAEKEKGLCAVGCKLATFSVWVKRNELMQWKGVWFELYRNETAKSILELWLDDSFSDKDQIRIYDLVQTKMISDFFG